MMQQPIRPNASPKTIFKGDTVVWVIFMLLCCFSLVEVFSATSTLAYKDANIWTPIIRHAIFLFVGTLCILGLVQLPSRYYPFGLLLLPLSVAFLAMTYFMGVTMNDASRWLVLLGIQFQPSEIAKLASIIYVAFWLSRRDRLSDKTVFRLIIGGVGLVCLLIFPTNFSTSLILGIVCFVLMFIGQLPARMLLKLAGVILAVGLLFIGTMQLLPAEVSKSILPRRAQTWQNRIKTFTESDAAEQQKENGNGNTIVITDENYQQSHAKIAIARGGMLGRLPGQSIQRDFLPQAYSDFIYAIIVEELGIVGGIFVLLLYIMLMFRVGIIAKRCDKLFHKYLVIGSGLLVVLQALIHIGINVGLFPVSGQPLPLISRGGTSTILTCIYIGIILGVSHHGARMDADELPDDEEEDDDLLSPSTELLTSNPV